MDIVKIDIVNDYYGRDEYYGDWFICPKCKSEDIMNKVNYCSNCGAKIEWVDTTKKEKND